MDTKKKELIGDFKNPGRDWRPKADPEPVRVHEFPHSRERQNGKGVPYGVYDLTRNEARVGVCIDHDTASFAVHTIRRWCELMGRHAFPETTALLITADAGGSNGSRVRLRKWELQQFANRTGLAITVCHFPPGTSKRNKIGHRLFSHIAMNWRGKLLVDLATTVRLIGETTADAGLRIRTEIDDGHYPKVVKITADQMAQLQLSSHAFHGEWNYTPQPRIRNQ